MFIKIKYIFVTLFFISIFFISFLPFNTQSTSNYFLMNYVFGTLVLIFISMIIGSVIFIIYDLFKFFEWAGYVVFKIFKTSKPVPLFSPIISRYTFLIWLGTVLSGTLFVSLFKGFFNKYNFKFKNITVRFLNLPQDFNGLKIVQISDIHSGSFRSSKPLENLVEKINKLHPDLILFSGDLVNNEAIEMLPHIQNFKKLKAQYGVYSILGNHDYGDYKQWSSTAAKEKNFNDLIDTHQKLGWTLLRNQHICLKHPTSEASVYLLGVENWSKMARFGKHGDLKKTLMHVPEDSFKILMSHDPTHFEAEVEPHYPHIHLTLSGHTHGFQFGVNQPFLKWSPVEYVYKYWAGLYGKNNQYLYVNTGMGCIGYQGRVGILPEITVINLEKS